jgi:tRNA-splicing ligase RtcB
MSRPLQGLPTSHTKSKAQKKKTEFESASSVTTSPTVVAGKYVITESGADCVVYLPKEEFIGDLPTLSQIKEMIVNPALKGQKIRIMPDVHRCYGCCVGLTAELGPYIIPNLISKDIGCGMVVYPMPERLFNHRSLEKIEKILKSNLKMGNGHENIWQKSIVSQKEIDTLLEGCRVQAQNFAQSYLTKFNVDITEHIPPYTLEWLHQKCLQIGANYETDIKRTAGTLGGGNHFAEINEDPENSQKYLAVHCGSRSIGGHICQYHQDKIKEGRKFPTEEFESKLKSIERQHRDSKTIKQKTDEVRQEIEIQKHTPYLEGAEAYEYYFDMIFAQQYACLNRRLILGNLLSALEPSHTHMSLPIDEETSEDDEGLPPLVPNQNHFIIATVKKDLTTYFDESLIIESIHNYIDFTDLCIRKGAISAHAGQKCIIAMNMKLGLVIAEGLGSSEWNNSCSHGLGRKFPRGQANRHLSMKDFRKDMESVVTTSVCRETLDECPQAYKDPNVVLGQLGETVKILKYLRAVVNLKAPN